MDWLATRIERADRAESGQALVIVLGLITLLFLTGTALAAQASVALRAGAANVGEASVLYAGDAGGELGIWWQRNAKAGAPPQITMNGLTVNTTVSTTGGSGAGTGTAWKQWGYSPTSVSTSSSTGPIAYAARWSTFPTVAQGTSVSSPVVASDGYVYVGGSTGLYAYKPDGSLAWSFLSASQSPAVGSFSGSPAIVTTSSGARMIVAATNGAGTPSSGTYSTVFGLTENGAHSAVSVTWSYGLATRGNNQGFIAGPKLNAAGTRAYVAAQNSTLYGFDTAAVGSATPLWTASTGNTVIQPVALNTAETRIFVVTCCNTTKLRDYNASTGVELWNATMQGADSPSAPVFATVAGRDHVYLAHDTDHRLRAWSVTDSGAAVDWAVDFAKYDVKSRTAYSPPAVRVISGSTYLYVGEDNGGVWKVQDLGIDCAAITGVGCGTTGGWIHVAVDSPLRAAPAIDTTGAIFMANNAGSIYRITDAGSSATSVLWPVALGAVGSELVIGTDGDLYAMTGTGRLLAIGASLAPAVVTVTAVAGGNTVTVVYPDAGSGAPTLSTWTTSR